MRVCVIIPTTAGPAAIVRLVRLHKAPLSVMRTQDDYRALPPSPRYHEFTQPGGPLRKFLTLSDDRFELRVAARIESGRSWELPVALAHWLEARGHDLVSEASDVVVWATGALDNDLKIIPQDYHLEQKLSRSSGIIAEHQEQRSNILLLSPGAIETQSQLVGSVSLQVVDSLSQAVAITAQALTEVEPDGRAQIPSKVDRQSAKRASWVWGGLTGIALILGGTLAVPRLINSSPTQPLGESGVGPLPLIETDLDPHMGSAEQPETFPISLPPSETAAVGEEPEVGNPDQRDPEPLIAQESTVLLRSIPRLVLDYAPEGTSCPDVLFGAIDPRREYRAVTDGGYGKVSPLDLCAVGVEHSLTADYTLQLLPPGELQSYVLSADWQDSLMLQPGSEAMFRLRAAVPLDFTGHWTFEGSGDGSTEVQFELFAAQ